MEAGAAGTGLGEGGVNVHDEGVCPNGGGSSAGVKTKGRESQHSARGPCQGPPPRRKKNAEKGRAETSACEVQTVTQSDAVGACLRSPCSCSSSRTCAPRSPTRGLSGVFCGGFVVFLAGGAEELAEVPLDLGPRCRHCRQARRWPPCTSKRARQAGGGRWGALTHWGPGCKACLVARQRPFSGPGWER